MIDVANGYTTAFFEFLCRVRKEFPNTFIAAGNVATPDILKEYKDAGVDCVKIGIGPWWSMQNKRNSRSGCSTINCCDGLCRGSR
jgi:IMP dehydrogenase/GMP reductase